MFVLGRQKEQARQVKQSRQACVPRQSLAVSYMSYCIHIIPYMCHTVFISFIYVHVVCRVPSILRIHVSCQCFMVVRFTRETFTYCSNFRHASWRPQLADPVLSDCSLARRPCSLFADWHQLSQLGAIRERFAGSPHSRQSDCRESSAKLC